MQIPVVVVDAILLLVALEAAALAWWRQRTGRGPSVAHSWSFLGAGAALLLALRAALAGWPVSVALAALAVAGAAHAAHLALDARDAQALRDGRKPAGPGLAGDPGPPHRA